MPSPRPVSAVFKGFRTGARSASPVPIRRDRKPSAVELEEAPKELPSAIEKAKHGDGEHKEMKHRLTQVSNRRATITHLAGQSRRQGLHKGAEHAVHGASLPDGDSDERGRLRMNTLGDLEQCQRVG